MLRCQAMSMAARPPTRSLAGMRPARRSAARVACAAPPEGGSSSSQPPSSRQRARVEPALAPLGLDGQQPYPGSGDEAQPHHGAAAAASAAGSGASAAAEPERGSWEDWMRHFYAMDDMVNDLEALYSDQQEAVAREDYKAAAAIKAQRLQLEASDALADALDALDAAVEEERYADAARLRDESGLGLLGWWVGRGPGDDHGHLLRVTTDFGRYCGMVYSPRDLAELIPGIAESNRSGISVLSLAGQTLEPEAPPRPEELGLPVLEVFVRRNAETGGYEQQAAALYAPEGALAEVAEDAAGEGVAETIAEMIASASPPGTDSVVSVERGQSPDGSSYVTIEISSSSGDDELLQDGAQADEEDEDVQAVAAAASEEADDDDGIRTIDDLAASVGMAPAGKEEEQEEEAAGTQPADAQQAEAESEAGPGSAEAAAAGDEAAELARWREETAAAGGSGRSVEEEVDALTRALLAAGDTASAEDLEEAQQSWEQEGVEVTATQIASMLQRTPAQIVWEGRDRFTVTVTEPPAFAAARQQAEAEAAARDPPPPLQKPPLRIIYDGKEQQQQQDSEQPGPEASSSSSSSGDAAEGSSVDVQFQEGASEEISVLLSGSSSQQQQPGQQDGQPPAEALEQAASEGQEQQDVQQQQQRAEQGAVAEDSAELAAQIEAVREEMEAGRKPSKEQLNEIARRAMGLAIAQGISSTNAAGLAAGDRWSLEGRTTYERLPAGHAKTDPFSGLYLGSFGPHGPELLHVTRQQEGGREWAVATKLTGDPNVPAGTVSWKAVIGRGARLPVEMYPADMGVTARYKGQGQVAQTGFTNPKWVDGELLVFAPGSPFVRGAQLGFTYEVRASQRYLIVLHRVELDEMFEEEE